MKKLSFVFGIILLIFSTSVLATYNLSGSWNNGKEHIFQYKGKLTVFIENKKRGPFLGWYTGDNSIAVNFTDDGGCCIGNITGNGEIIRWSNGSKWVKD